MTTIKGIKKFGIYFAILAIILTLLPSTRLQNKIPKAQAITPISQISVSELDAIKPATIPNIVYMNDFGVDHDGAIGLQMLAYLQHIGYVNLKAVVSDSSLVQSQYLIDSILSSYNISDVPIGVYDLANAALGTESHGYHQGQIDNPNMVMLRNSYADSTVVLRQALANAPEEKVTILTNGPLRSLRALMQSATNFNGDGLPSGIQLIEDHVDKLLCGAGYFFKDLGPTNLLMLPVTDAQIALSTWYSQLSSVPIIFIGEDASDGQDRSIDNGGSINFKRSRLLIGENIWPEDNPARYYWGQVQGESTDFGDDGYFGTGFGESHDLIRTFYAVFGANGYFELSNPGVCTVVDDENITWTPNAEANSFYLLSPEDASDLDDLVARIAYTSAFEVSPYSTSPDLPYTSQTIEGSTKPLNPYLNYPNRSYTLTDPGETTTWDLDFSTGGNPVVSNPASASAQRLFGSEGDYYYGDFGTTNYYRIYAYKTINSVKYYSPFTPGNWVDPGEIWTYNSARSITVASGAPSRYTIGGQIKFQNNDSGIDLIGTITNVSDTLLTIAGATVPNATLTDNYYCGYTVEFAVPDLGGIGTTVHVAWDAVPGIDGYFITTSNASLENFDTYKETALTYINDTGLPSWDNSGAWGLLIPSEINSTVPDAWKWKITVNFPATSDDVTLDIRTVDEYFNHTTLETFTAEAQADSHYFELTWNGSSYDLTQDITAPVTSASQSGAIITLSATDSALGIVSGVDKTYYKWDSGSYTQYSSPLTASVGTHILYYYSVDNIGYTEDAKSLSVTVNAPATPTDTPVITSPESTSASTPPTPAFSTTAPRFGQRNSLVTKLQNLLKRQGYFPRYQRSTGYFGWTTRWAVIKYQKAKYLKISGIIDAATLTYLNYNGHGYIFTKTLKIGNQGKEVIILQAKLKSGKYMSRWITTTGYFGNLTKTALKRYQKAHRLPQTGVLDGPTREVINLH